MAPNRSFGPRSIVLLVALLYVPAAARGQQLAPKDTTRPDSGSAPPAVSAPPKPAPPAVQLSGVLFGDYQIQTDVATRAANGGTSRNRFELDRAYLTVAGPVGGRASFRVTTDIKQNAGAGSFYNGLFVRLKYGYLQYDYLRSAPDTRGLSAYARLGLLHTVLIDHQEKFWPRFLGPVAVDRFGFFSSSDLGLATNVTLPGGLGEIYGTVTNGNGYENPEADRFKDVALRLSLTPLGRLRTGDGARPSALSTFTISPWFYAGQKESRFLASDSVTGGLARNRWGLFVGVRDPRLTVGAEYARRTDGSESGETIAERTVTTTTGELYSGFVVLRPLAFVAPTPRVSLGLVARADRFTPDRAADATQTFSTVGLFLEPTPRMALAVDYQRQRARGTPTGAQAPAATSIWYLHWQVQF